MSKLINVEISILSILIIIAIQWIMTHPSTHIEIYT